MELPRKPNSNKSSPNFPSQTGTISSRTSTHGWSLFTSNVGAKSKNIYIRIFLLLGMTIIIKSGSYAIIYVSSVPDIESPSHPLSPTTLPPMWNMQTMSFSRKFTESYSRSFLCALLIKSSFSKKKKKFWGGMRRNMPTNYQSFPLLASSHPTPPPKRHFINFLEI